MISNALLTSKSDEWTTPQGLFYYLDQALSFTVDAAATKENALVEKFYTKEIDGLAQSWWHERVFCNPPYSEVGLWTAKAARTFTDYEYGTGAAVLIPARTDTRWFFDNVWNANCNVVFFKGRLKFSGSKTSAPFPSCLVIYGFSAREIKKVKDVLDLGCTHWINCRNEFTLKGF